MGKNRIISPNLETSYAHDEWPWCTQNEWLQEDESEDLRDERVEESFRTIPCKDTRPLETPISSNFEELSRVFEMFSNVNAAPAPARFIAGTLDWTRTDLVAIDRKQLEAMVSRIAALVRQITICPSPSGVSSKTSWSS